MGIFNKIFGGKARDERLLGTWQSDQSDLQSQQTIGQVSMSFSKDGKLQYAIHEGEKTQFILLNYWTEAEKLFTDQPSAPKVEQTNYFLPDDDTLILEFENHTSRFKRTKILSPESL